MGMFCLINEMNNFFSFLSLSFLTESCSFCMVGIASHADVLRASDGPKERLRACVRACVGGEGAKVVNDCIKLMMSQGTWMVRVRTEKTKESESYKSFIY